MLLSAIGNQTNIFYKTSTTNNKETDQKTWTPPSLRGMVPFLTGSWHLPLSSNGGLEPVGTEYYPEDLARRLAAAKLIGNRKAVVPFALRGVGFPGVPGYGAELSDPNAKPNEAFKAPVDAALRCVQGSITPKASNWIEFKSFYFSNGGISSYMHILQVFST